MAEIQRQSAGNLKKPRDKVLTRASRRKAGLPPPTPLFKGLPKLAHPDPARPSNLHPRLSCCSGRGSPELESDSSGSDEEESVVWVQCDNTACQKWRRLPPDNPVDLGGEWYCHMHPDPRYQSCSASEERWRVSRKRAFTFSRLTASQLVWAKMRGYSPWPAIISPDPWSEGEYVCEEREGCIYHVEFLGKPRTHRWIPEEQVEPYHSDRRCSLGAVKRSKKLDFALQEAESFLFLSCEERLERCEYQGRETPLTQTEIGPPRSLANCDMKRSGHPSKQKSTIHSSNFHQKQGRAKHKAKKFKIKEENQQVPNLAQMPDLFGGPSRDLVSHASLFDCLGIPLTVSNLVNIVGSVVQKALPQTTHELLSQSTFQIPTSTALGGSDSFLKPATSSIGSSFSPDEDSFGASAAVTIVPSHRSRHTAVSDVLKVPPLQPTNLFGNMQQVPNSVCAPLKPQRNPKSRKELNTCVGKSPASQNRPLPHNLALSNTPLTQTSLTLTNHGTVQLTKGRRRKQTGVKGGSKKIGSPTVKKSRRRSKQELTPTLEDYLPKSASPVCVLRCENPTSHVSFPLSGPDTTVAAKSSSTVQEVPEEDTVFLQLESAAQGEMREIEEMLSLFAPNNLTISPTPKVQLSPHASKPLSGRNSLHGEGDLEQEDIDIDSMLQEMTQIEGLIQDLSTGQIVPYEM